jgi:aminopeptidase N
MWLKLFVLISAANFSLGTLSPNPRKLYKVKNVSEDIPEMVPIKPFKDPYDNIDYRLPNNTKPLHYDVWLKTDIDQGISNFSGQLTISNVRLERDTGSLVQSSVDFNRNETVEFLTITPTRVLNKDLRYRVIITYFGILRNDDAGFYRSSYVDRSGKKKWLATTQFESTDARHAFPW